MTKENIQPLHNNSVVPSIASDFWEKEQKWEKSLHTYPDGGTIPSLCKVGATGELKDKKIIRTTYSVTEWLLWIKEKDWRRCIITSPERADHMEDWSTVFSVKVQYLDEL